MTCMHAGPSTVCRLHPVGGGGGGGGEGERKGGEGERKGGRRR